MLHNPLHDFPPSRAAARERLTAYAPQAGRAYASGRNTDPGPGKPQAVSMLSPYLRRRMITEREVVAEVLKHHSLEAAEKFIQEVFWRAYFKGWLEMRPSVWDRYLIERQNGFRDLEKDGALRRDYEAAIAGETGIEGFDDWAQELVETGWLHNHARMWFASIWIFTLRLPWALGADFFYQHLVDADPASNTLSWRWVGGLHTRGKTYLARPDNIAKFSNGRFRPTDLAAFAEPLDEDLEHPAPLPPPEGRTRVPDGDYALLLTTDDLNPESWPGWQANPPKLIITVGQLPLEAELNGGDKATAFTRSALAEAADRIVSNGDGTQHVALAPDWDAINQACADHGLSCLCHPMAMAGPSAAFVATKDRTIPANSGLELHPVQRSWDVHAFPRATAGFFKLKKAIPKLLARADLN
ncbi:MAG: FAD-binding domain-containing protein [Pseudomonadota bacterium]